MQKKAKKSYQKPVLNPLGSIEEVTGWVAGGAGEYFGGTKTAKISLKKGHGPGDFGS